MYHKWQSCDVWFLRYEAQRTEFFVILDHFLPFYPPNNPKNPKFWKMKKTTGDNIILHVYYKWQSYDAWFLRDRVRRTDFFLSLWTIFYPFTLLTTQKNKIVKQWKSAWRYHHFAQVRQKLWSHDVRFQRYGARWTDGRKDVKSDI